MKERISNNIDNYVMASRILETLAAYLITNEDVLGIEHIISLKEQIETVERYKRESFNSIFKDIKQLKKDALYFEH